MKKIVALVLSLVMVLGLATTAFAATSYVGTLKQADVNGTTIAKNVSAVKFDGKAPTKLLPGQITYYEVTVGTATDLYAPTDEPAVTDVYLELANKTKIYLTAIDSVEYWETGAKYTKTSDLNCSYLTTDEVYYNGYRFYTMDGVVGLFEESTDADAVATKVGNVVKMLKATDEAADPDVFVQHQWVKNDVDNKGKTTSYICAKCEAVATVVPSADFVPAGNIPFYVDNDLCYVTTAGKLVEGTTAVAPEAPVESPKTFDAGIAMYVGMSVMAAAGSAVVLKKKD